MDNLKRAFLTSVDRLGLIVIAAVATGLLPVGAVLLFVFYPAGCLSLLCDAKDFYADLPKYWRLAGQLGRPFENYRMVVTGDAPERPPSPLGETGVWVGDDTSWTKVLDGQLDPIFAGTPGEPAKSTSERVRDCWREGVFPGEGLADDVADLETRLAATEAARDRAFDKIIEIVSRQEEVKAAARRGSL